MIPSVSEGVKSIPIASVGDMGKVLRRARGTGIGNVQTNYLIPPESKQKLEDISARMGKSAAEGLELILDHLDLEADGLPAWFDRSTIPEAAFPMSKAS